jgi:mono/diheme cytochrome c family protein
VKMAKRISRRALVLWTAILVFLGVAATATLAIRRGFSARDNPSWVETFVARTARSMAVPAKAKSMKNPFPNSPENLAEARAHWADHCANCHANNGSGETEIGRSLYPKAPDMRLPATQGLSDGELYYTIQNGIRLTGMPAWGQAGDNDEASWKLVQFIRRLPQLTAAEEMEMEKLNPKGPDDRKEEQEEDKFLQGSEAPAMSDHKDHQVKPKENK